MDNLEELAANNKKADKAARIAAANKKLGLPADANLFHRTVNRANKAIWAAPSAIAGIPARGAKSVLEGMFLGPVNRNPLSPAFGKRMSAVGGSENNLKQISRAEYNEIKSGNKPGRVTTAKDGLGKAYFKQKYRPGGLVGFAQKHPLLAGGAGLLAYYLMTNRGARDAAGGMVGGVAPNFVTAPTADVQQAWAQPSYENPLAKDVWGR